MRRLNLFFLLTFFISSSLSARDFTLTPMVHSYEEICLDQGIKPASTTLKQMCQIVTKNELCKKVPASDLLNCSTVGQNSQLDTWEFIKGCTKGVFTSAKEILQFLWGVMELAWDGDKRGSLAQGSSDFMGSAKLYLHTEYQKALKRSKPPMQESKALVSMSGAIGNLVLDKISQFIAEEYQEFGCLNFEAKSKYMCKVMGDIFIPPAGVIALLKLGPKAAVKQFPNLKKAVTAPKPAAVAVKATAKNIWEKYPKLQKTLDSIKIADQSKISHARDIPFEESSAFRPVKPSEMRKRAADLPPDIQKAVTGVYNALGDKTVLEPYFKQLMKESAEWMAKKGRPADLKLLEKGVISEHAMSVVLIQRFKKSGDNQFTTVMPRGSNKLISVGGKNIDPSDMNTMNDAFRVAVRSGPFMDRAFEMTSGKRLGHGVINHMIQRDIVKDVVKKEMKGNPQKFYDFLGTKKGINWWADLFDSGDNTKGFTRPENISKFMHHTITESKLDD